MTREFHIVSFDDDSQVIEVDDRVEVLRYRFSFVDKGQLILAGPQKSFRVCYQPVE